MGNKKKLFNYLTNEQVQKKVDFIKHYIDSENNASASLVDPNSNVSEKNIGTMASELYKFENIQVNRAIVQNKLRELFGNEIAQQYHKDIENHLLYCHDETNSAPYCASVTMYPFLLNGTKSLGGTSKAPKNLQSFCGSFVNLVYQLATNWSGATATVEFLMYFDYFARLEYGTDYLELHEHEIKQELQGVIYALNQPAAARGNQSVFWNISIFDEYYFEQIFGGFLFPDDTPPDYDSISKLQAFFLEWFRKEREKELLTYPVLTAAILIDKEGEPKDREFADVLAYEMSKGLSFFIYESESADSLASCCRLRNELADNTFSYTLGAGGVSAGSFRVITINMNRYVQLYEHQLPFSNLVKRVHKYLVAHREVIKDYIKANMLPAYSAKFITIDHQFGTVGINGMLEAMEFKHLSPESKDIASREEYKRQVGKYLESIYKIDKEDAKKYGFRFNCECVPAEGLGVKNAQWDKHDGLCLNRDCYNSYFYPVESQGMTILDKLDCHGKAVTRYLDGGSAVHLNIAQLLTECQALDLIRIAGRLGVNYWTFNCLVTICDNCGYINVNTLDYCTKCGETEKIDHGTRVIGYLKRVSSYSKERQEEAAKRFYSRR